MASLLFNRACNASALRVSFLKQIPRKQVFRTFADESPKDVLRTRVARRRTLKEQAMAPPTDKPFNIGKGALIAGGALGIGALCFYGLGLSNQPGAIEKSMIWPQYVKDRITSTYLYFGSSIAVTTASAMAAFRSPAIMNIVTRNGFMGLAISMAAIIGTGMVAQSIEYKPGFGPKQMAWLLHAGVMGAMLAPMCFVGGPILMRAAWYTTGVVGGLSAIAVCAPSEKFLMMGGPLAMGLGVVIASSIGTMFLPPTTALGAGLYSISLYGGLLLFSGFLLYDTQKIIAKAERHPNYPMVGMPQYDPINAALSIYMDTLNIFIRIVTILAGGGNRRK